MPSDELKEQREEVGFYYNVTSDRLRTVANNGIELDRVISDALNRWPDAELSIRVMYHPLIPEQGENG